MLGNLSLCLESPLPTKNNPNKELSQGPQSYPHLQLQQSQSGLYFFMLTSSRFQCGEKHERDKAHILAPKAFLQYLF